MRKGECSQARTPACTQIQRAIGRGRRILKSAAESCTRWLRTAGDFCSDHQVAFSLRHRRATNKLSVASRLHQTVSLKVTVFVRLRQSTARLLSRLTVMELRN